MNAEAGAPQASTPQVLVFLRLEYPKNTAIEP